MSQMIFEQMIYEQMIFEQIWSGTGSPVGLNKRLENYVTNDL